MLVLGASQLLVQAHRFRLKQMCTKPDREERAYL
jgi:hypothetical protein